MMQIRTQEMQLVLPSEGLRIFEIVFQTRLQVPGRPPSTSRARSYSYTLPHRAVAYLIDRDGQRLSCDFAKSPQVMEYTLDVCCAAASPGAVSGIPPEIELKLWLISTFGTGSEHPERMTLPHCSVYEIVEHLKTSKKLAGLVKDNQILSFLVDLPAAEAVAQYLIRTGMLDALAACGLINESQQQVLSQDANQDEFADTDPGFRVPPFSDANSGLQEDEAEEVHSDLILVSVDDGSVEPPIEVIDEHDHRPSVTPARGASGQVEIRRRRVTTMEPLTTATGRRGPKPE